MSGKPFHMGWFLGNSFGVHGWKQSWSGTGAQRWSDPSLHIDMARALDRACFDFMLMEDSVFVPDNYGASMDFYLTRAMRAPKNDPLPLVPLLNAGDEESRHRADHLDLASIRLICWRA